MTHSQKCRNHDIILDEFGKYLATVHVTSIYAHRATLKVQQNIKKRCRFECSNLHNHQSQSSEFRKQSESVQKKMLMVVLKPLHVPDCWCVCVPSSSLQDITEVPPPVIQSRSAAACEVTQSFLLDSPLIPRLRIQIHFDF